MSRPVIVKLDARLDLLEQFDWLYERSPKAALDFFNQAHALFELLRRHPFAGRPWPSPPRGLRGLRLIGVTGFEPIRVFYRPLRGCVEVVRVVHGARDARALMRTRKR